MRNCRVREAQFSRACDAVVGFLRPIKRSCSSMGQTQRRFCVALALCFLLVVFSSAMSRLFLDWAMTPVRSQTGRLVARSSKHVKHKQLVLGPAAGQGLPGRVQCEDGASLQAVTTRSKLVACALPDDEMVTFVTMFVSDRAQQQPSVGTSRNAWWNGGGRFTTPVDKRFAVLNVFLQSVEVSMPGSEAVVITDPDSEFQTDSLPPNTVVKYIHGNYTRNTLMLQRLESYIAFLKLVREQHRKKTISKHIVFSDSDIIVVDDLKCAFTKYASWHVAMTFRNNKRQPINSGVFMVRGTKEGLTRGKAFLTNVVKVFKARFSGSAKMLGDQLAIAWILRNLSSISMERFSQTEAFEANVLGTRVLFLPCLSYNWTPAEGAGQFHGMPEDVKVLHFKGSTKNLMLHAWNFYKSQRKPSFSNMKCLILKSGRTKYQF